MAKALGGASPQGFSRRRSLGQPVMLLPKADEAMLQMVVEATCGRHRRPTWPCWGEPPNPRK
ncbi:hypothetical protein [Synechococcus sp. RedBA-s]|uniref:hypothetical protein n=1 Tax=Synechococcus sp. RedBA-s TaxID=2823741 RepID=UPI0020CD2034|nr:hypothetical protein [Synechococcus sp. RedBA-s]